VVMAFSRLYLGVHFASDVIAGFLAAAARVAVRASAFGVIRRRSGQSKACLTGSLALSPGWDTSAWRF
jgi:membrane-associated phospholipid phosphatase